MLTYAIVSSALHSDSGQNEQFARGQARRALQVQVISLCDATIALELVARLKCSNVTKIGYIRQISQLSVTPSRRRTCIAWTKHNDENDRRCTD